MIISGITPPQVWAASARSLTNFGSGALTAANTVRTTLAAGANLDQRTSPGIIGLATVQILTGGAATAASTIRLYDGTTGQQLAATAAAANSNAGFAMNNNNTVGMLLTNGDGVNSGFYMIAQLLMTI